MINDQIPMTKVRTAPGVYPLRSPLIRIKALMSKLYQSLPTTQR